MISLLVSVFFAVTIAYEAKYGNPNGKIVGGRLAKPGEIPYIVSLRYRKSHFCGATILDAYHILTAAHCIVNRVSHPSRLSIQYGVTHITKDETNSIAVKDIYIHPGYLNTVHHKDDIAVLTLENWIPLSASVKPVVLPKQNEKIPGSKPAFLAGWGRHNYSIKNRIYDLKLVEVFCYTDEECLKALPTRINPKEHVCAGVPEGRKGSCSGDSGGPLIVDGVQVGVISFGIKPCTEKGPGVSTKVSNYVDWINFERLMF